MSDTNLTTAPEAGAIKRKSAFRRLTEMREFVLGVIVVLAVVILSVSTQYFLTWQNIRTVLSSMSTDGIIVIGMTILLISGGLDLSVGSVMCLSMVICANLFKSNGFNPWIAALVALTVCAAIGWVMGMLVTKIKLTHFIVTLCMLGIARGLVLTLSGGTPISLVAAMGTVPAFRFLGNGSVVGVPMQVVIFAVLAITADFLVRRGKIMRLVFYTGSNAKAAIYSGIRTSKILIGTTMVSTVSAGMAGIIYLSRFSGVPLTAGTGLEMTAISACVIGGASLTGGKGTILGSVLGLAFMALVTNAMTMFGVSARSQDLIRYTILLSAVALDQIQQNMAKKRAM